MVVSWWLLLPGAVMVGTIIGAARDAAKYEAESRRRSAEFDRELRARRAQMEWDR